MLIGYTYIKMAIIPGLLLKGHTRYASVDDKSDRPSNTSTTVRATINTLHHALVLDRPSPRGCRP